MEQKSMKLKSMKRKRGKRGNRFPTTACDVHDCVVNVFERLNTQELMLHEKPSDKSLDQLDECKSLADSQKSLSVDENADSRSVTPQTDGSPADVASVNSSEDYEDDFEYPPMRRVIFITFALFIAMFLVALDRTVVATAVPQITDQFQSFGDIGWYESAFMLTLCAFQLLYGRIYAFYNPKVLFLASLSIFEVGSVICAVAQNSSTVIAGRAVAGLGSSGIFSGTIMLTTHLVPLHQRAGVISAIGAMYGIGGATAPLIGGLLTSDLSWRWNFYINLPVGGVAFVLLFFLLKVPHRESRETLTLKQHFMRLDPLGTAFFLPCITCLLLALQWGGTTYPWSSWQLILLLTLFSMLLVCFAYVQYRLGDLATVPPRILSHRTVLAAITYSFTNGAALMIVMYYLPTWLQAVMGLSPIASGIAAMPFVGAVLLGSASAGSFVVYTGYYNPPLILSSVIMAVGAGLLLTFTPHTSRVLYLSLSTVFGYGLGLGNQQAALAAQAALPRRTDTTIGIALTFFSQTLAGAVFVAVGQNVLFSSLISKAEAILPAASTLSGTDIATMIITTGVTEIRNMIPAAYVPDVLEAFNNALRDVWKVAIGVSAASLVAALALEWKNVKNQKIARPNATAPMPAVLPQVEARGHSVTVLDV